MEIKLQERGRFRGNLDLQASMDTMIVGERWRIPEDALNIRTIRNAVSKANRVTDKVFSSQCAGLTDPFITITRIH